MIERARRGPYDNLSTPADAANYIIPHLNPTWRIWEPAAGAGQLATFLEAIGFVVSATRDDFLSADGVYGIPLWNCIVTNPPFSKKAEFLARCEEHAMPWALLLPVTTLGVRKCQPYLEDAEIVFLPRRIDFTGKKRPWFAVAWFTKGLKIGKQLTFSQ